jgi:pantetheine-phosphate adenylyltransferase
MKRIGFTSGSFDPVTNGHVDVIARAARMVDTLVIGIGVHPGKSPLFSLEEKMDMLRTETAAIAKKTGCRIEIVTFDALTVDAARVAGATHIFRGLREIGRAHV